MVREEELIDDVASGFLIGWFCVAQLTIDVLYSLLLGVGRVFLEGVMNDVVVQTALIFLMKEAGLGIGFYNLVDMFFFEDGITVKDDLITLDRYHFACIFVHEVLMPSVEHTGSKTTTEVFLKTCLRDFYLFCKVEYLEDILVTLEAYGTEESRYRQLFLTVDVGIHDIVDIRGKFYPRSFERNDTSRIELGTIGMVRLSEEHPWRTV